MIGFSEAYCLGGLDLERQERANYKKEQEDSHMANHRAFRDMMDRYKKEAADEAALVAVDGVAVEGVQQRSGSVSDAESSKTQSHFSTYNTKSLE